MWRYFMPTEVFFGFGALKENGRAMERLGKRALVVTGKSSRRNGSLDDLKDALDSIGVRYEIYDEVGENPSFEMLRDARKRFSNERFDFIVGLGGGSPMDFAKAISVLLKNPNLNVPEIYDTNKYNSMYPVIAIPTTSGTGSEVTQYSVITDDEGNKGGFGTPFTFPTLSFVDPRYTKTMPKNLTMSTGIDALCHAVEGYVSKRSGPLSDTLALEAIKLIKDNLERAMEDPENLEHREKMSLASNLAGIVIAQTGTTITHAFGYPLTTFKGIRHGQATGIFLPYTLKIMMEGSEKVKDVLEIFGGLEGLEDFLKRVGVYDVKVDISEDEIDRWAERTSKARHISVTPGRFDLETVRRIYEEVAKRLE